MQILQDMTTEVALVVVLEDLVAVAQAALGAAEAEAPAVVEQAAAGKAIKLNLAPIVTTPKAFY